MAGSIVANIRLCVLFGGPNMLAEFRQLVERVIFTIDKSLNVRKPTQKATQTIKTKTIILLSKFHNEVGAVRFWDLRHSRGTVCSQRLLHKGESIFLRWCPLVDS